jgi:hypothetical protein
MAFYFYGFLIPLSESFISRNRLGEYIYATKADVAIDIIEHPRRYDLTM